MLPGPWWQGLEVVEEVGGGLGLGCRLGAGLGLGLGLGGGLGLWRGGGIGLLLGSGLGWWLGFGLWLGGGFGPRLGCGCGLRWGALPPRFAVAGRGAAGVLAAVGALAAWTGFGARVGVVSRGRGGEVLDEVVVVVEVGEFGREALLEEVEGVDGEDAEADEMDVGDGGGGFGSGAAIWVLWARRVRVWVRASGVCAHFPSCPVCVQVPVLWAVSCVVCGGVVESSWMCGLVSYSGGGSTLAAGRVGAFARGSGWFRRRPAGCRACPPP